MGSFFDNWFTDKYPPHSCLLLYGDLYIVVTVWWWAVVEKVIVLPLLDLEYYMKSKNKKWNVGHHDLFWMMV
jgi:hypothetical protein